MDKTAAEPGEYPFGFLLKKGARIIWWVSVGYVLLSVSSPLSCNTHLDPQPLLQPLKSPIFSNNTDKPKLTPYFHFLIPSEASFQQQYFSLGGEGDIGEHLPSAADTKDHSHE